MIRVLGTKRILMLIFLIAINAALASSVYLFLMPQHIKKQRELSALNGQVSTVRTDIDRMQIEFDQLAEQQNRFEKLKEKGFFYNQGRRQAELVLEKIQKQAGVVAAVANIQAGMVQEDEEAQKAEHKILSSPVKIHIDAVDPVDVYRYVYLLDNFFPGHVAINNIRMVRTDEVTGPVLRSIASGSNPVLVQADIEMTWRTMVPQSELDPAAATPAAP
jgi:hypothetical protein